MSTDFKNITNQTDFERFCCEVAKEVFGDFLASRYGRNGQKQNGIDIRAQDLHGRHGRVVIQCKFNHEPDAATVLQKAQTEFANDFGTACTALKNALDFDTFIYAGLWPSDTQLQNQASAFQQQTQKNVVVWSLETLQTHVNNSSRLQRLYAPQGVSEQGALLLDPDFWVDVQNTVPDPLMFYAGQQSGGQQWAGVVRGLAAPRDCPPLYTNALTRHCHALPNWKKKCWL